jgi:hypothetical protein
LTVKNVAVVKAITLLFSSLAAMLPIVYGLAAHGWDVRSMLAPSYTPPKVDFRLEFSGFRLDKRACCNPQAHKNDRGKRHKKVLCGPLLANSKGRLRYT